MIFVHSVWGLSVWGLSVLAPSNAMRTFFLHIFLTPKFLHNYDNFFVVEPPGCMGVARLHGGGQLLLPV